MDTGTKAASIQSCDVAAALLFRIGSHVFEGARSSRYGHDVKQQAWRTWHAVRIAAAAVARDRMIPPLGCALKEFRTLLNGAHGFGGFGIRCFNGAALQPPLERPFTECECEVANLCRTVMTLIFSPGSAELLNHGDEEGGRGQSPEPDAGLQCPASLRRFLDGVSDRL
jgi:hypothetical protein